MLAARSAAEPVASVTSRRELHERLLSVSFAQFASTVAIILARLGYEDVRPAGRTIGAKQSQSVGYDFSALLPGLAPGSGRRVIIQIKQYGRDVWVYQRQVDELRGKCLRVGASEALLITTGPLSYSIRRSQMQNTPVAPVRLIDGDELLDLLLSHPLTSLPTAQKKQAPGKETDAGQNTGNGSGKVDKPSALAATPPAPPSLNMPRVSVTIFLTATGGEESANKRNARSHQAQ